jgi:hypothetical protein
LPNSGVSAAPPPVAIPTTPLASPPVAHPAAPPRHRVHPRPTHRHAPRRGRGGCQACREPMPADEYCCGVY